MAQCTCGSFSRIASGGGALCSATATEIIFSAFVFDVPYVYAPVVNHRLAGLSLDHERSVANLVVHRSSGGSALLIICHNLH